MSNQDFTYTTFYSSYTVDDLTKSISGAKKRAFNKPQGGRNVAMPQKTTPTPANAFVPKNTTPSIDETVQLNDLVGPPLFQDLSIPTFDSPAHHTHISAPVKFQPSMICKKNVPPSFQNCSKTTTKPCDLNNHKLVPKINTSEHVVSNQIMLTSVIGHRTKTSQSLHYNIYDMYTDEQTSLPLAEKYKPSRQSELVGNQNTIAVIKRWLESRKRQDPKTEKALFMYGPTGCGKTVTARVLLKETGYRIYEINVTTLVKGESLVDDIRKTICVSGLKGPQAVLIEELDAVIKLQKVIDSGTNHGEETPNGNPIEPVSKVGNMVDLLKKLGRACPPIIFTCNNKQNKQCREIAEKCLQVHLYAPFDSDLIAFVIRISRREQKLIDNTLAKTLVQQSNRDIRKLLSLLQLQYFGGVNIGVASNNNQSALTAKQKLDTFLKTTTFDEFNDNIFSTTETLIYSDKNNLSLSRALNIYASDPELMQFMVFENYPNTFGFIDPYRSDFKELQKQDMQDLDALSKTADTFSHIDSMQDWKMQMPAVNCLAAWSTHKYKSINSCGKICGREDIRFTQQLSKISQVNAMRKNKKMLLNRFSNGSVPIDEYDTFIDLIQTHLQRYPKMTVDEKQQICQFLYNKNLSDEELQSLRKSEGIARKNQLLNFGTGKNSLITHIKEMNKPTIQKLAPKHTIPPSQPKVTKRKRCAEPKANKKRKLNLSVPPKQKSTPNEFKRSLVSKLTLRKMKKEYKNESCDVVN